MRQNYRRVERCCASCAHAYVERPGDDRYCTLGAPVPRSAASSAIVMSHYVSPEYVCDAWQAKGGDRR